MIKAIAFDAYGTLFDVFSVFQTCEKIYPGKGGDISRIWRQKQLEYSWLCTLMGRYKNFWHITEDALCYALEELHLPYNDAKIKSLMQSYLNLNTYPETADALPLLGSYKKVILSNGTDDMLNQLVSNTGMNKYFSGILSADPLKLYKPRAEVYKSALDYLQVEKHELLFVSSNGWDIAGAKAFGFIAAWINRMSKPEEKLDVKPDYTVSSLLELSSIAAQI